MKTLLKTFIVTFLFASFVVSGCKETVGSKEMPTENNPVDKNPSDAYENQMVDEGDEE